VGGAAGLALAGALAFYYRWADQDSFARICRHEYAVAHTAVDSQRVDARVAEPSYPDDVREGLSCGDLRRLGKLGARQAAED
jgi:hypothetical protein